MEPKEYYLSKPWLKYYPDGVPPEVDVPEVSVPERSIRWRKIRQKSGLNFLRPKNQLPGAQGKSPIDLPPRWRIWASKKGDTVALYL